MVCISRDARGIPGQPTLGGSLDGLRLMCIEGRLMLSMGAAIGFSDEDY
jgi:hypothetical protein